MCSQQIPLWEALIHFSAHSQLGKKGTDPVGTLEEVGEQPALLRATRTTATKPHIQQLATLTLRGNTPCATEGNHRARAAGHNTTISVHRLRPCTETGRSRALLCCPKGTRGCCGLQHEPQSPASPLCVPAPAPRGCSQTHTQLGWDREL